MLFRNVGHNHPVTPRHIPEDWRSQLHRFESLKKSQLPHLRNFTCLVQTRGRFRFRTGGGVSTAGLILGLKSE